MTPEDRRGGLRPKLAAPGEDVARVMPPCDVAAQNTLCWGGWEGPEASVFLIGGACRQEVVLYSARLSRVSGDFRALSHLHH